MCNMQLLLPCRQFLPPVGHTHHCLCCCAWLVGHLPVCGLGSHPLRKLFYCLPIFFWAENHFHESAPAPLFSYKWQHSLFIFHGRFGVYSTSWSTTSTPSDPQPSLGSIKTAVCAQSSPPGLRAVSPFIQACCKPCTKMFFLFSQWSLKRFK